MDQLCICFKFLFTTLVLLATAVVYYFYQIWNGKTDTNAADSDVTYDNDPTYDSALRNGEPTFTFAARGRNIIQPLLKYASNTFDVNKSDKQRIKICIFGAGCIKEKRFCPEFMEISMIFSKYHIDFTIIDKDDDVINAIQNNNIYYLPHDFEQYQQQQIDDINIDNNMKYKLLNEIIQKTESTSHNTKNQRRYKRDKCKHRVNIIQTDFVEVFEQNKLNENELFDIIIANNCLFFAFNDDRLKDKKWEYLVNILAKLNMKNNGIMFIDSASLYMIQNVEKRLDNVGYNVEHLGWRNHIISHTK